MSKGNRDESYSEIQKGDKVYYFNAQLQEHSGKAFLYGPAGWVIDCDHGPVVVQEGNNYAGHTAGKNREDDSNLENGFDYFGKWFNG